MTENIDLGPSAQPSPKIIRNILTITGTFLGVLLVIINRTLTIRLSLATLIAFIIGFFYRWSQQKTDTLS